MEVTSCSSLVCCLHFSTNTHLTNKCFFHKTFNPNKPRSNLYLGSSLPSTFFRNYNFLGKYFQHNVICSSSTSNNQNPSPQFALLLEVDGVLIDAYRLGNRQAFNAGFRKLGLDCANWTEPIYKDLLKKTAGDEEKMLTLFFNRIGWPSSLPTSEQGAFVKKVLQEKKTALEEFMVSKDLPLRPGVEDFLDDAISKGISVVILTAYGKIEEKVARSIVDKLGEKRIAKLNIIGSEEAEQSSYGQLMLQKLFSGLDDELAKEATKAASAEKQRIANEVASLLKLKVEIDTSSSKSLDKIIPALRAGAERTGLPIKECVLVAGSHYGVAGAGSIGMPCVVLRSSEVANLSRSLRLGKCDIVISQMQNFPSLNSACLTARAQFPSAQAVMDGFGGADLTVSRLENKRWSQN